MTLPRCAARAPRPALALAVLTLVAPLPAQDRPVSLMPGARVRVEAPPVGAGRAVRRVHAQRGDTLLLVPDRGGKSGLGDTVAVALADVRRLEVSRGWHRRAIAGAFVGLAVGAAAGAVHGNNRYEPGPRVCFIVCDKVSRGTLIYWYALLGAHVGSSAGLAIGFALGDSWERLVPGGARVGVAPAPGGLRVGVSIPTR